MHNFCSAATGGLCGLHWLPLDRSAPPQALHWTCMDMKARPAAPEAGERLAGTAPYVAGPESVVISRETCPVVSSVSLSQPKALEEWQ